METPAVAACGSPETTVAELRFVLLLIDALVALTAGVGGFLLVSGAERGRLSTDILRRTPFRSFNVPGLILAFAVGGSAAVATILLAADRTVGGAASAFAGVLLASFILTEIAVLEDEPGIQPAEVIYLFVAALMVVLGLVLLLAG